MKQLSNLNNKKRLLLMSALTLAVCIGAVYVSRARAESPKPAAPSWAQDPNLQLSSATSTSDALKRLVISVVVVVVVGSVAIWASKKYLPRISAVKGKNMRVLDTVQLAPNRALHIVEVGSQKFLIGSSVDSVRMLADVTLSLTDEFSKDSPNENK
jgi:flagellar biogenesis protein FliO